MVSGPAYYVVKTDGAWRIKLEDGRYLQGRHRKQQRAIDRARRIARKPDTKGNYVVVNAAEGYTRRHIKNP